MPELEDDFEGIGDESIAFAPDSYVEPICSLSE